MQDKFEINNGILIRYKGNDEIIVIPDNLTSIGKYAFAECSSLKSIQLPDSITSIGEEAFSGCKNLESIQLPENLTSIDKYAFSRCESLKSIQLPENLTSIGKEAFLWCESLKSIQLPENLTSIDKYAFSRCESLESIQLPENLTSIGENAFLWCKSLKSIQLPENLTSIGKEAFSWCCSLTSIQLPANLTSIGKNAFSWCESLTIYGYAGSYAQEYAEQNKIPFIIINKEKDKDDEDRVIGKQIIESIQTKNLKLYLYWAINWERKLEPNNIEFNIPFENYDRDKLLKTFDITFRSLDESIATVDQTGHVQAKKEGKTNIVVEAYGVKKEVKIEVILG